ncbi:hypothetical protein ACIKTA_17440 [Hansschlegelia beijingensis]|uniref:hypothetical protein n=1 Tax=Hansschlegelia beijingensis TaxID=1133344 RepID=UPI00382A7AE6
MTPASQIAGFAAVAIGILCIAYTFWLTFRMQRQAGREPVLGKAASRFLLTHGRHFAIWFLLWCAVLALMVTAGILERHS